MTALTVFDHLALHPFLADLTSDWLHRLAARGRAVMWPATRRVFREDAPADRFWLLCSGTVALDFHVPGRGDVVIERVGDGGVIGWSWLIEPHRWTLGAVAAEDCRAIEFDARGVRNLLAEHPDLGREVTARFLEVMADRLQASRRRLIELYAYPAAVTEAPNPAHPRPMAE
jgi:CRP/FNR family transcriptional regulator, cyclic AMP receptor protein